MATRLEKFIKKLNNNLLAKSNITLVYEKKFNERDNSFNYTFYFNDYAIYGWKDAVMYIDHSINPNKKGAESSSIQIRNKYSINEDKNEVIFLLFKDTYITANSLTQIINWLNNNFDNITKHLNKLYKKYKIAYIERYKNKINFNKDNNSCYFCNRQSNSENFDKDILEKANSLYYKLISDHEFFSIPTYNRFLEFSKFFKDNYKSFYDGDEYYNKKISCSLLDIINKENNYLFYTVLCCIFNIIIHKENFIEIKKYFYQNDLKNIIDNNNNIFCSCCFCDK